MRVRTAVILFSMLLLGLSVSLAGPDGVLRVTAVYSNPAGDWSGTFWFEGEPFSTMIEADSTAGLGIVYEYKIGEKIGFETGLFVTDFDFVMSIGGIPGDVEFGSSTAIPITAGLTFHPVESDAVDFYIGPLVGLTVWGDLETSEGNVSTDSDFGVGAVAGIDIPVGEGGWAFSAALRYFTSGAGDDSLTIDVDPLHIEVGVGYRF
jgi:outer membrane protein W